jgi:hypothetical protein
MKTLREHLDHVDDLDQHGTLYIAEPARADAPAAVVRDAGEAPAGMSYLLEVRLAREAIEVWSEWRDGRTPSSQDRCAAVLHYAAHDAYLPVGEPIDTDSELEIGATSRDGLASMAPMDRSDVCTRLGVTPDWPLPGTKLGVSGAALAGQWPLHGLRHRAEGDSNGWYIWSGEFSESPDFFLPLHIEHVAERIPAAAAYLALPPGFRFMVAPGHEDVWEDRSLL